MKHYQLRSGQSLAVREAKKEDALVILDYANIVGAETDNLTFGEGGLGISEDKEAAIIKAITESDNQLMICGFINEKLVGQLVFRGGSRPRTRHVGEFGITVLKEHWGKGVGSELLNFLIACAKETQIVRKINLKARSDNHSALNLYKKLGFVSEGTMTREFFINSKFYDSIHMGLEIN